MAVPQFVEMLEAREGPDKSLKKNKKDEKRFLLVSQELKIARALAGNDKPMRYRAIKSLKRWFHHRSQKLPFTEDDFLRLWKGLFYSMWMSDKPLIQEECAENIASLLHELPLDHSLQLFKCGLLTLRNEWFGIDQLRLDKFMMFVRRLLRQALFVLKKSGFNKKTIIHFGDILDSTILDLKKKDAMGLLLHFTEIFWEELAKVSEGTLRPDLVNDFLTPFIKVLATADDDRIIKHLRKFVFMHLISQTNIGLEYQEKYSAWKKEGFPGTIHAMQKVEVAENGSHTDDQEKKEEMKVKRSTINKPLDPRAGRVDVELPQININPKSIAELLLKHKYLEGSTVATRKTLSVLVKQFKKLANGTYPLGVTNLQLPKSEIDDMKLRKAVNRLVKFEKKLLGQDSRSKKRKLKVNGEKQDVKKQKLGDKIKQSSDEFDEKDNLDEKLEEFIKNSEGNLKLKKKIKISVKEPSSSTSIDVGQKRKSSFVETNIFNIETPLKKTKRKSSISESEPESAFERNSGLWLVYNQDESDVSGFLDNSSADLGNFLENKIENLSCISVDTKMKADSSSPKEGQMNNISLMNKLAEKSDNIDDSSAVQIASGKSMIKNNSTNNKKKSIEESLTGKFGSPSTKEEIENSLSSSTKELFPKKPWDEPLEEGEYEICIPSKSYVEKLKRISRKSSLNVQALINNSLGKSRHSLDFKKRLNCSTPQSAKRVKINTGLNQSQEFHEYHSQVLLSPAITFDANKRPGKPLLKTPIVNSPINPFYKQLCDF